MYLIKTYFKNLKYDSLIQKRLIFILIKLTNIKLIT